MTAARAKTRLIEAYEASTSDSHDAAIAAAASLWGGRGSVEITDTHLAADLLRTILAGFPRRRSPPVDVHDDTPEASDLPEGYCGTTRTTKPEGPSSDP